jgi:aspartyl-tRNA(Asn)/glutamyl-tRNA(Gln) amidotransferase subunit C
MNIQDIEHLAELAKIELPDLEKENLSKDLDSILDYVKIIESVEIPTQVVEYQNKNVMREDVPVARAFARATLINQFPDSQDGFLKVKKIL